MQQIAKLIKDKILFAENQLSRKSLDQFGLLGLCDSILSMIESFIPYEISDKTDKSEESANVSFNLDLSNQ